jgi:hypothetical protein
MNKKNENFFGKDLLSSLKEFITTPCTGVSAISLLLLVLTSPIFSFLWLCVSTLRFLYVSNHKAIFKIWVFTIGMWYFIFTTSLSERTIFIGFEHTPPVLLYLLDNDLLFTNLCVQTTILLDMLSARVGFPIYIPTFVSIFSSY